MPNYSSKIVFLISEDWFFCSHFMDRAKAAKQKGYEIVVIAREGLHREEIQAAGLKFIPLSISRRSLNPFKELKLIFDIWRLYKQEQPDIVHHIAIKPILYGSLAAILLKSPAILNAPVGMGYIFSSSELRAKILRPFINLSYRLLLNPKRSRVIFENDEDMENFIKSSAVRRGDAVLIPGAGVDTNQLYPAPAPSGPVVVVLVARMLKDKGIYEFVEAAKHLHKSRMDARFVLIGDIDPENPASLSRSELESWNGKYGVEWWGWRSNIKSILQNAHIACLPSYREGLPKSLLEAAACGLPIVTTDAVGCRNVVRHEDNGFLVPVRDASALAESLRILILDSNLRCKMGIRSRERAEAEFSSKHIISKTLDVYSDLQS